jgi:hypothetical protein
MSQGVFHETLERDKDSFTCDRLSSKHMTDRKPEAMTVS